MEPKMQAKSHKRIRQLLAAKLEKHGIDCDVTVYEVNQTRGRAYFKHNFITVPSWCFERGKQYVDYYLSHELAHILAGRDANHGPEFQEWLQLLTDYPHFEHDYKPRLAAAAGISKK